MSLFTVRNMIPKSIRHMTSTVMPAKAGMTVCSERPQLLFFRLACAAANLATGTRGAEQET
jgi:hypothetical protein